MFLLATALLMILTAGGHLFSESNGLTGLQSSAGTCEDINRRTRAWVADAKVI